MDHTDIPRHGVRIAALAWVAGLALAVAACGGGGSSAPSPPGGSFGGGPTPSPTPTPTSTPAPSPGGGTIASFAPFGVTANTEMQVLGLYTDAAGARWLDPGELSMLWLATDRTFTATFPGYGSGRIVDDPDNLARAATYFVNGGGQRLARSNFFIPNEPAGPNAFRLSGSYRPLAEDADIPSASFFYFPRTFAAPQTSGSADFLGLDDVQQTKARLIIDYSNGTVIGTVSVTYTDAWGPYPETLYQVRDGRYDRATGRITGLFDIPGSGFDGELRGQLLGGEGEVLVMVARGAVREPYENTWVAATRFITYRNQKTVPVS